MRGRACRPFEVPPPGSRTGTIREPREQRCQHPAREFVRPSGSPVPPSVDAARLERVLFEIKRVIVGQDRLVERMLVALLARGHVLLEGVPGVAKTLAVETLATAVGGTFARLQFTPDLVPADIIGTRIYGPARTPSTPNSARSSPTSCSPTRSTARRPRCSRRCWRSWPSGRCRSAA